jgi:hypothetical protein
MSHVHFRIMVMGLTSRPTGDQDEAAFLHAAASRGVGTGTLTSEWCAE